MQARFPPCIFYLLKSSRQINVFQSAGFDGLVGNQSRPLYRSTQLRSCIRSVWRVSFVILFALFDVLLCISLLWFQRSFHPKMLWKRNHTKIPQADLLFNPFINASIAKPSSNFNQTIEFHNYQIVSRDERENIVSSSLKKKGRRTTARVEAVGAYKQPSCLSGHLPFQGRQLRRSFWPFSNPQEKFSHLGQGFLRFLTCRMGAKSESG